MSPTGETPTVALSIQRAGHEQEPVAAHVTGGVLAAADRVVVPSPPEELLDPDTGFDALLVPFRSAADQPVERIRVAAVRAARSTGTGALTGAVLELSRPSRYPPMLSEFSGCRLNTALRARGDDLRAALEDVGALGPRGRDLPWDRLLAGVPERERAQRAAGVTVRVFGDPGDHGDIFCSWLKWPCHPCRP